MAAIIYFLPAHSQKYAMAFCLALTPEKSPTGSITFGENCQRICTNTLNVHFFVIVKC